MIPKPYRIEVRFRDMDKMGHVNNAVYFSYLEMARVHYMNEMVGRDFDYFEDGFLLARNEIDYRLPMVLGDEAQCEMWVEKIGNTSFLLGYKIFNDKKLFAEAKSVMVSYNSNKMSKQPIIPKLRQALEKLMRS